MQTDVPQEPEGLDRGYRADDLPAPAEDVAPEPIGPVPGEERITVIDCLRGAALFGILVANMRGFNAPMDAYIDADLMWKWMPDRVMQAIVDWLVQGKFITIFAVLFGIGFAIQMERAAARGRGIWFYVRRMAVLLLIGLAHSFLLWWGDILVSYALCGFLLMLFRKRGQRALFWWAQGMYWFMVVLFLGIYIAMRFGMPIPEPPIDPNAFQRTIDAYARGTFQEIFVTRAHEWSQANSFILFLTRVLGIFLIGVYLWRQGYLRQPREHLEWWRKAQRIGLPVGLLLNLAAVLLDWIVNPNLMRPNGVTVTMFALLSFGQPALSLGYSATLVLLWQDERWQRRLMPFSYVGRMALTNYLLQSLVCTTIFYSYGIGLYGQVGPILDLVLAIVIYGLQIPFSKWWLSRHRYGPMEWVWRRLTYGRLTFSSAR